MPHVINGTGTWYYGRDSRHFHTGVCEHCRSHGHLASYDTTLYFTLFFVPLVPLGRKRVVDECPKCHRHRVVKLKDWVRARHVDIRRAVEAFRETPDDAAKALSAIGLAVAYQHRESYDVTRMLVERSLSGHAGVQAALAAAAGYFGQLVEAEESYRKSLALEDNREVREALAVNLMRQSRPVDALPLIEHVFAEESPEHWGLAALLVECYQAEGEHEDALALLDRCEKKWPALATDQDLQRLRSVSTKHRDRAKRVPSALLSPPPKTDAAETTSRGSRLARLIGPTVAVLLIGWYLGAAYYTGRHRGVHLVNGTAVPYEVVIDGTTYQLHPRHRREIEVTEGELTIEVLHPGVEPNPETIRLETGFFSRPFKSPVFVINPDRTAILLREEVVYSERPGHGAGEGSWSSGVGELLYRFQAIDYPFREFPEEIRTSSGGAVRKSRLQVFREDPRRAFMVAASRGEHVAAEYLKNSLQYDPASIEHLRLLELVLSPEEIVDITRPRLTDRPVRVEWHRLYQRMMEIADPEHDLEEEYVRLLQAEPEEATLHYLAGRVTRDPARAERRVVESTRGSHPTAYGYAALAFRRLGAARYSEALSFVRRAIELAPGIPGFDELESLTLLALGRYDELYAANEAARQAEPFNLERVVRQIDLLVRQGKAPEAGQVVNRHCEALRKEGADVEWTERARTYLTGVYDYRLGREKSAGEFFAKLDETGTDWQAALCQGKTSEASRIIMESKDTDFVAHLLVYISARLEGDVALAERHLEAGAADLGKQGYAERRFAAWLSGEEEADADEANELVMRIDHKCVVLTAMGLRYPSRKKKLFDLAAKLNFDIAFPHRLLKRAHASPGL